MHSICKIENKSHFIREKFLIFDLVFEKITIFLFFEGYFYVNFQKNRSQKPSMLEEKQGQFWNLHRIPNKTSNPNFRFLSLFFFFQFFSGLKKVIVIFIRKSSLIKKNFIFSINSIVFYEIFYNDVTASRDDTYLITDPDEICTAYVKLNSKHILFVRIFRFSIYFSR